MASQPDPWAEFRTPAPTGPRPSQMGSGVPELVVGRQPAPQTPTQEAIDRARLREMEGGSVPQGFRRTADGNLEYIPGGPADPATPRNRSTRQLPQTAIDRLGEGTTGVMSLDRAASTFQDDYAGNALTGSLENTIQSRFSGFGTPGQQQWWADIQATDNVLRHALFGASLTAGEQAAWDRTTVTPSMAPAQVRTNLARRAELARDILRRQARTYRANGYNEEAIRESLGELGSLIDNDTVDDVRNAVDQARQRQQGQPEAASPPRAPPGTEVAFWDDPTAPKPPGADQFQTDLQDAINRGFFTTPEEIIQFGQRRGFNIRREQAEAAIEQGGASVGIPTFERPNIDDARGPDAQVNPILGAVTAGLGGPENLDAAARGAADVASLGMADEISAAGDTIFNGGTYGENLYRQRAIDDYDRQNNPYARLAGQVAGGIAIPTGVGRTTFGAARTALREGATREGARAAARAAGARRLGLEGAAFGGAYGFGSGEGSLGDRLSSGGVSALVGGAAGYGLGLGVGAIVDRYGRGGESPRYRNALEAYEARQAAENQGIDLLPADVGGPTIRRLTAGAAQMPFASGPVMRAARNTVDQTQAARDRIAGEVGQVLDTEAAGETARRGAMAYRTMSRNQVSRAYDRAAELAGDARIDPVNARTALDRHIAELSESPLGVNPVLTSIRDRLEGTFTVAGLRNLRTTMRDEFANAGLRGTDTERRAMQIVDELTDDIATGLTRQGRGEAAQAYRVADQMHRDRVRMIDDVLAPIIGSRGEKSGEQVVQSIQQAMRGNSRRARDFVDALPQEEQGDVRATLIGQLGRAANGQQNAEGSAFSLSTFLTNWNALQPSAREAVFGRAANKALGELAQVAARSRQAQAYANTSGTAGAANVSELARGLSYLSGYGTLGATAIVENLSGRLLTNPVFVRWLAREPANPAQAQRNIAQLGKIARTQPAISSEVLGLRQALMRNLGERTAPLAAQSDSEQ